jgi:hypothetical protein
MRTLALVLTLTGCLSGPEISGQWNVGGIDGCHGETVHVTVSDGGQHTADTFACRLGRFEIDTPSSSARLFLSADDGYVTVHLEVDDVTDDRYVGVLRFQ